MPKKLFGLLTLISLLTGCGRYKVKDDGVYYKDWNEARGSAIRRIPDADPKTFKTLKNSAYGKDKNYVFYRGKKIAGADPATFKIVNDLYTIDKQRAYYAGKPIIGSSSKDFEVIDDYYSKDYKDVYHGTEPLNVCSVKNFRFVYNDDSEKRGERWTTDGCHYYTGNLRIPSDDYANIKLFKGSAGIAVDGKYAYFRDKRIPADVDVATFQVTNYMECRDKYGCINVIRGRVDCN